MRNSVKVILTADCEIVELPVDGTFDSCQGSTISGQYNNNVTCAGYGNGTGSADTWSPPLSPNTNSANTFSGLAEGMLPSPQGGVFAAAGAWYNGESFYTTLDAVQGTLYSVSFYQANAGNGPHASSNYQTQIGDVVSWKVIFDGQVETSPGMAYEGAGNQTWNFVELSFTSTITGPVILEFQNAGASGGVNPRYYAAADGIVIKEDCPPPGAAPLVEPVEDNHEMEGSATSIRENTEGNSIVKLFPNPARDKVTISQSSPAKYDLRVMNYTGQLVREVKDVTLENFVMDLSDIDPGLYLMHFLIEDKQIVKKLIVE